MNNKVNEPKDEELILLNCLVYSYVDGKSILNFEGYDVEKYIDLIKIKGIDKVTGGYLNSGEWNNIVIGILEDKYLLSLKITSADEDTLGGAMICFVHEDENVAIALYRGTGIYEWDDNTRGGYLEDTPQQVKALTWINKIYENKYNKIIATGHSKGGNKAQYVTIVSNNIDKCITFNAQGFSDEFCQKYKNKIRRNQDKIRSICMSDDYVNILLCTVAGIKEYILPEKDIYKNMIDGKITDYVYEHCLNRMLKFDNDGQVSLREKTIQEPLMQYFHDFTVYFEEKASDKDEKELLDYLGPFLDRILNEQKVLSDNIDLKWAKETMDSINIINKYFIEFNMSLNGKYIELVKKYSIDKLLIKFLFGEIKKVEALDLQKGLRSMLKIEND